MSLYFYSYSHLYIFTVFGGWFPFVLCVLHSASQLSPTLCDPTDCSPPGSSVMGLSRQEYWSGLPCPPPENLPHPRIKPISPALQADSLPLSQWETPPFLLLSFFLFHKHILSFECVFFITSCSFFIDVVSSPFLLRILNIDFFFFYYTLLPVLSLYSLSSYCLFPFLYMSSYHNSDMS